jgi:hypothetical protein
VTLTDTIWHTTLQQQVPAEALSRVSSFDWTVSMMIFPLGSALAGPLADAVGVQSALTIMAVVAGAPLLAVLLSPSVRAIRRTDGLVSDDDAQEPINSLEPAWQEEAAA